MNHDHDDKRPIALPLEEVQSMAKAVAAEMKSAPGGALPLALRRKFIDVRAALFQRGIYDPILVRFDSATSPPASLAEVAAELESVAEGLGGA